MPTRHDFPLDDWEIRCILRLRQIVQSAPGTIVHVDPAARMIVAMVSQRPELLDAPVVMPPLTPASASV
jgi:hypothetical protein